MVTNNRVMRPRRALAALLMVGAATAMAALPVSAAPSRAAHPAATSTANAAAPPAQPVGNYSGNATANLVHASVLAGIPVPGGTLVDAQVIPAASSVDSTATPQSKATAKNVGIGITSAQIPVQDATQTAAPDNPAHLKKTLLPVNLSPLANVQAVTADVNARWAGPDQCVAVGQPISYSKAEVASVDLLKLLPGTTPIVSLNNQAGGTLYTNTTVGLVNVAGQSTQGVQSAATTQLTGVDLAGGFTLNVVAPLQLTATAGGTPGSAKVVASQPVIELMQGTTPVFKFDATHTSTALPGNPLVNLSLGKVTKSEAANGRTASADGSLLSISLLSVPAGPTLASVKLGESHVDATAPQGGVKCPPPFNPLNELHKDVSSATVAPGGTFTYTVSVPNRGTTPIDNLTVVDQISGPAGFSVVSTQPQGQVSGNSVTWHDTAPLQPNETRNYTITVKTPANAPIGSTFTDKATASGTYAGRDVTQTVTLPNVPKVTNPPFADCRLSDSNKAADHLEVQPGETFNYYIHVLNDGQQPCGNVSVSDTLSSQVTFVSCSTNCTHSGQVVTWNVGTVAPGSSQTLTVTVKVAASATGSIPNTALVHQPGKGDITLHTNGPKVTTNSVLAPANPPGFGSGGGSAGTGGGKGKLAFTGWNQPLWLVTLLLAAAAGGVLVLRTRRQD